MQTYVFSPAKADLSTLANKILQLFDLDHDLAAQRSAGIGKLFHVGRAARMDQGDQHSHSSTSTEDYVADSGRNASRSVGHTSGAQLLSIVEMIIQNTKHPE